MEVEIWVHGLNDSIDYLERILQIKEIKVSFWLTIEIDFLYILLCYNKHIWKKIENGFSTRTLKEIVELIKTLKR